LLIAPNFLDSLVTARIPVSDEPEVTTLASHHLIRAQKVASLTREAGFARLRTFWQGYRCQIEMPEEFWDIQSTFSSIARKRLLKASPEQVQAVREEFLAACRRTQSKFGHLVYPVGAFYVAAERPRA
jgi:hypothetical protein